MKSFYVTHALFLTVFCLSSQTRPSAQALHTSLLFQCYPGTNANKLFPNNSGNNRKNNSSDSASGVQSELERVLEENRRLKQQLGLH